MQTLFLGGPGGKNSTFTKDAVPPKQETTLRNVLNTTSTPVRPIKHSATFRKSDLKNRAGLKGTKDGVPTDNKDMGEFLVLLVTGRLKIESCGFRKSILDFHNLFFNILTKHIYFFYENNKYKPFIRK